jgi:hypothetical protein
MFLSFASKFRQQKTVLCDTADPSGEIAEFVPVGRSYPRQYAENLELL